MKHWKIFGVAAAAITLAPALASTASATTLTGPSGETTPTLHLISEEDTTPGTNHVTFHNAIANTECESTITGAVTTHGANVTTSGHISALSFYNCTGGWVADIANNGTFEVHMTSTAGHGVGTVTWSGGTWITTRFGVSCGYRTENTHIGTLTGGNPATLRLEASIPRHSGSFLCGGSNIAWTGAFATTSTLKIDA
jgi:hypothetical protein